MYKFVVSVQFVGVRVQFVGVRARRPAGGRPARVPCGPGPKFLPRPRQLDLELDWEDAAE